MNVTSVGEQNGGLSLDQCHPPLPVERSQWHAPFECVGVDHTRHFHVRQDDGERQKVYICLFVCTVTRAVYLETVTSLTATSFLRYLRRLAATHGTPQVLLSDNHRSFLATERFLHDLQQDPEIQDFIAARHIEWRKQTPGPLGPAGILKDL